MPASSKHLIIGGLGGLGRHLQRQLLEQGAAVRVLDRPSALAQAVTVDPAVEVQAYTAGVDDPAILRRALENVETVYSVVTPDVQYGTIRDFETTNVLGVQHIVQACQEVGTPKLVHGSSMAVTNHWIDTVNGTEGDPLPPMASYQSHYDRTKRLGEEIALAANDKDNLQVCALRLGGILGHYNDYTFRFNFATPGQIRTTPSQKIDFIAAADASRAFWHAHQHMEQAAGKAIYVTKGAADDDGQQVPTPTEIGQYLGQVLEWPTQVIPSWIFSGIWWATRFHYNLLTVPFQTRTELLPGVPPHVYMEIAQHQKTFDNTLAKNVLHFESNISWKQAVENVAKQYRQANL